MDVLPDSRAKRPTGLILNSPMGNLVPVFCASCSKLGGHCPEENMTFLFYECKECFAKLGELTNTMAMPDEIFWQFVADAQTEKYGRVLTAEETVKSLDDPLSLESLLARDREALTPQAGT